MSVFIKNLDNGMYRNLSIFTDSKLQAAADRQESKADV